MEYPLQLIRINKFVPFSFQAAVMAQYNSKRPTSSLDRRPVKRGHWTQGLLASMEDPALFVLKDDLVVAIKDKYPKARHHYLVLPHNKISALKNLKRDHVSLLTHMHEVGQTLAQRHAESEFRLGYHAVPSMAQVHLHVISQDFDSPCLKTKKHWNSFNTNYFLNSSDVLKDLQENGIIKSISSDEQKNLLSTPLQCHKCSYQPSNIPKLKSHLQQHVKN